MSFIRALGCLLLCAVLATACASDDPSSTSAPFDAVLIELFGTVDTEAYLVSAERDAAELVVICMNEAGFDYQIPPLLETLDAPDPLDLEAVQADGFGIIAGFRFQLSNFDMSVPQGYDPNIGYLSSLAPAEANRFLFTLNGPEVEPGQRQEGGCNGQASDQAYADWLRFFDVLPNFTALGEERDTHPDWLTARAEWRSCMLDRGFDYGEPDAIRAAVIARMRDTVNEVYPGGQVPLLETDGVFTVDPAVDVLLDELVQFERAAAIANVKCTEPIADQFAEVERLVQGEFVERHQEAIDALLESNQAAST